MPLIITQLLPCATESGHNQDMATLNSVAPVPIPVGLMHTSNFKLS